MKIGITEIKTVIIHCELFNGANLNIPDIGGIMTTTTCNNIPNITAPIKNLFLNIP